jgi:hypothetical protein
LLLLLLLLLQYKYIFSLEELITDSVLNLFDIISKFCTTVMFVTVNVLGNISYRVCRHVHDVSPHQISYV